MSNWCIGCGRDINDGDYCQGCQKIVEQIPLIERSSRISDPIVEEIVPDEDEGDNEVGF